MQITAKSFRTLEVRPIFVFMNPSLFLLIRCKQELTDSLYFGIYWMSRTKTIRRVFEIACVIHHCNTYNLLSVYFRKILAKNVIVWYFKIEKTKVRIPIYTRRCHHPSFGYWASSWAQLCFVCGGNCAVMPNLVYTIRWDRTDEFVYFVQCLKFRPKNK